MIEFQIVNVSKINHNKTKLHFIINFVHEIQNIKFKTTEINKDSIKQCIF